MLMLKDLAAMFLIGDGVIGLVTPERHVRRWLRWRSLGPAGDARHRRRAALRAAAGAEAVIGLWFASRLPAKSSPASGQPRRVRPASPAPALTSPVLAGRAR